MPAKDMLDVLHYFFEEDLHVATAEEADARDKTRSSIYRNLYNREYAHARPSSANAAQNWDDDPGFQAEAPIEPFNPAQKTKPYTPPTDFNPNAAKPFGSVLDAPLG